MASGSEDPAEEREAPGPAGAGDRADARPRRRERRERDEEGADRQTFFMDELWGPRTESDD